MAKLQELSAKIAQDLDVMLPKNVRCVIVLIDTNDQDICAVSDLPDDKAKLLLEEAALVLGEPGSMQDLDLKKDIKGLN